MAATVNSPKPEAHQAPPSHSASRGVASLDFAGSYPFTNIGKPGHNRNFDDPIEEAKWAKSEYPLIADDQRQRSDKEEQMRAGKAA